jgi:hypothetical protein
VSGKQRETRAAELLAGVRRSSDPDAAAAREIEWLERATETAERWQVQEEEFLARAIELMRRTEQARGAATRAANERTRIEGDRRREKERLRKNALARERYAERRRTQAARVDKRTGMHALGIEVDPVAYRAVKAEALRRRITIPALIGRVLERGSAEILNESPAIRSGWSRTGDGRRAKQHTRIEVDDATWRRVQVAALQAGHTLGRWVGIAIESSMAGRGSGVT